jgi:predicted ATPase
MKISVEGYKSIAKKRTVQLSGLTILSGANSSGKSSFMQPLLLIKQSLENDFDAGSLLLDGPNVKLSDSSEIISKVPSTESGHLKIALLDDDKESVIVYKFRERKGIHIDSVFQKDQVFKDGIKLFFGMKPAEIDLIAPSPQMKAFREIFGKDGKRVSWRVSRERCFLELSMQIDGKNVPYGINISPASRFGSIATRLIHVPGLRGNPERSYKVASADSLYPGSFEKYVASIVHNWKIDKRHHSKFDALVKQLNLLGLASSIETHSINDTRLELRISRHKGCDKTSKNFVNIADVGFGVSQTLPVLVALLTAKKGQIVYIEQPELHLHPRAQFALAEVIADAVTARNINVVIETHSSILIRGIQILVAKKELNPDVVSLNWFTQNSDSGQTDITEAKLDRVGAFGDWPEDFDEVILNVESMYLDAVEKAISNEI